MTKKRAILLSLAALYLVIEPVSTCFPRQAGSCPNYQNLHYPQVTVIPLPNANDLTQSCRQLTGGLNCFLGPTVLGNCPEANKAIYSTMLKVLEYPCSVKKEEYLLGAPCWTSPEISTMMTKCFTENQMIMRTNYCTGQRQFVECVTRDILTIANCGRREQVLVDTMLKTSYNSLAFIGRPSPCPQQQLINVNATTTASPGVTTATPDVVTNSTVIQTGEIRHDVTCGHTEMSFAIPMADQLSVDQVTLSDPTCHVDAGGNRLTGKTDLNACGTKVRFTNTSVIFSNEIFLSATNSSDSNRVIPIECQYDRGAVLTLSYLPLVRRVLFTEKGVGHFGFEIQQFQDDSFTSKVQESSYPLRTSPGQEIFVQLSLGDTDLVLRGHYGIHVEGCIVSPFGNLVSAQANGVYNELIENSCPAHSDVRVMEDHDSGTSNVSEHFRFSFKAVTFSNNSDSTPGLVYIHCRLQLCEAASCHRDHTSCRLPGGSRSKRAVSEYGERSNHQLSTGPLLVMADSVGETAGISASTPAVIVLGIVAALATLVAITVIVAWRRSRRGQGHRLLKVTADQQ